MFPGRSNDPFKNFDRNFDRNFNRMKTFVTIFIAFVFILVIGGIGTTAYIAIFHAKDAAHFVGELAVEAKNGYNGQ